VSAAKGERQRRSSSGDGSKSNVILEYNALCSGGGGTATLT